MKKVKIRKCGYKSLDGEVLVAEVDKELRPCEGAGESIWKGAGLTQDDLQVDYELIGGEVLVTPAKDIDNKFSAILHAIIPSTTIQSDERNKSLRKLYRSIFERAVSIPVTKIALPFLGIVSLDVPDQEGVDMALESIKEFLEENDNESLSEVIFFTTKGSTYQLAMNHKINVSDSEKDTANKGTSEDNNQFKWCVVSRFRDAIVKRNLAVGQAKCGGLGMHRLSSMIPQVSAPTDLYFGAAHEADLIMSRLGEYSVDWSNQNSLDFEICSDHLDRLSRDWSSSVFRNIRSRDNKWVCSFPDHRGFKGSPLPFVRLKADALQKSEAMRWTRRKGTVIQTGIPICDVDRDLIMSSEFDEQASSQETRELETMMEIDEGRDVNTLVEEMGAMPVPKKTPSTAKKSVKDAVVNLFDALQIGGVGRNKDWKFLEPKQRRNKASQVRKSIDAVCEVMAPDAKEELKELAIHSRRKVCDPWLPLKNHLEEVAELYERTDSKSHRLFVLSTVASFELSVLQVFFPDLTSYMLTKARRLVCNPVVQVNTGYRKERYCREKVERLLAFLLSPLIVLNLPFGERKEKMDDGSTIYLPNLMRLQSIDEVYRLYREYMIENDEKHLLLKETTAKAIIKLVAPTRRKNLTCCDEKIADGMRAYDDLFEMVADLERRGFVCKETALDITRLLQHSKAYLRGDYKAHIKKYSSCGDHCSTYALSDSKDHRLANDCSTAGLDAHTHDTRCERCEDVKLSIERVREALEAAEDETNDSSEREHFRTRLEEVDVCWIAIMELKKHQVRTAVSHGERAEYVEKLKPGVALVTLDWAQKLDPLYGREKQSEYFAKAGTGYHMSHALTVIGDDYAEHTSVHIVGAGVPQDGCAVSLIVEAFLSDLAEKGITSCVIRSDCAGCYKNASLMRSLIDMQGRVGVRIEGYLFSEAQSGKSDCDRGAASVKRKTRDAVAAKRSKVDTKESFYKVLTSGKLLNGLSVHVCTISEVKKVSSNIPNITSFSSFEFESSDIVLRRHRSIGDGILFDFSKLKPCDGKIDITENGGYYLDSGDEFWLTRASKGEREVKTTKKEEPSTPSVSRLIPCTEEGCSDEFISFREFDKHLLRGKHTRMLERETWHDLCAKRVASSLDTEFSLAATKLKVAIHRSVHSELTELEEGWALRSTQKRNPDDKPARELITKYFKKRKEEGKKCTPQEAELHMRTQKKPGGNGALLISPKNRLSYSQIKSLISGLLRKENDEKQKIQRKNEKEICDDENEEEEEEETDDEEELLELIKNSSIFDQSTMGDQDMEMNEHEPSTKLRRTK